MIENIEQLINAASVFESETEKVLFVLKYFLETVEYDYASLVAGGYMLGTISAVHSPNLIKNHFSKGIITRIINDEEKQFYDTFVQAREIAEGESILFNEIINLRNNSNGNLENFLIGLKEILLQELKKHLPMP